MTYSRTKHIEIRHHFLIDHVKKGDVIFKYVDNKNQLAGIFTKPLSTNPFHKIYRHWKFWILQVINRFCVASYF